MGRGIFKNDGGVYCNIGTDWLWAINVLQNFDNLLSNST